MVHFRAVIIVADQLFAYPLYFCCNFFPSHSPVQCRACGAAEWSSPKSGKYPCSFPYLNLMMTTRANSVTDHFGHVRIYHIRCTCAHLLRTRLYHPELSMGPFCVTRPNPTYGQLWYHHRRKPRSQCHCLPVAATHDRNLLQKWYNCLM